MSTVYITLINPTFTYYSNTSLIQIPSYYDFLNIHLKTRIMPLLTNDTIFDNYGHNTDTTNQLYKFDDFNYWKVNLINNIIVSFSPFTEE